MSSVIESIFGLPLWKWPVKLPDTELEVLSGFASFEKSNRR
jgi:hypothetical protein